ncbi:MAG: hypothetical protein IJS37_04870 [Bacilli bacterium]|nr:hypothetical protein [Bacilli bacterium]
MKKLILLPTLVLLMTACGGGTVSSSIGSGDQSGFDGSAEATSLETSAEGSPVSSAAEPTASTISKAPTSNILTFLGEQQLRFDNNTNGAATIRFVCDGVQINHSTPTSYARNAYYTFQIESNAPALYFYFVKENEDSVSYIVHPALLKEYYADYGSDIVTGLRLTDCRRFYIAVSTEASGWTHGLSSEMDKALASLEV